jgi:hypothetical protein
MGMAGESPSDRPNPAAAGGKEGGRVPKRVPLSRLAITAVGLSTVPLIAAVGSDCLGQMIR